MVARIVTVEEHRMIKAGALVVGERRGRGALLFDIATELGFSFVKPIGLRSPLPIKAQSVPVCFVLFAGVEDPEIHAPIIREIRRAEPRSLAFSPLIYFSENPSHETVASCTRLGFDDVMTMPFTRERVHTRLMRQIETPLIYFETADYFGPDRRRRSSPRIADAYLRGLRDIPPARRYEIRRSLSHGVMILREELIRQERSVA